MPLKKGSSQKTKRRNQYGINQDPKVWVSQRN